MYVLLLSQYKILWFNVFTMFVREAVWHLERRLTEKEREKIHLEKMFGGIAVFRFGDVQVQLAYVFIIVSEMLKLSEVCIL